LTLTHLTLLCLLFVWLMGASRIFPGVALWMLFGRRTMAPGEARERLEAMAARAGVAVREILVAQDHAWDGPLGGWLFGLTGRTYRVVLSQAAAARREIGEAIFAHELGHARRNHARFQGLLMLAAFLGLLGIVSATDQVLGRWSLAAGAFSLLSLSPAMTGVMRRFEREADLFAANLVGSASYIEALQAAQAAWPHSVLPAWLRNHPSVEDRADHILACERSPDHRDRFERSCGCARRAIAAFCAAGAMTLAVLLAMGV